MTTEQTMFNQQEGDTPPEQNIQAGSEQANQSIYEQLVGEGKKFSDNESLAKGKAEADTYISHLEEQNKELQKELDARVSAEEVAQQLRNELKSAQPEASPSTSGLSAEEVAALVRETITLEERNKTAQSNELAADKLFKDAYGDKAGEVLKTKANELGMSVEALGTVARQSPTAFARMVGITESSPTPRNDAPAKGTVNPEALGHHHSGPKEGSKAFWDAQRKEMGARFWDAKIQQQIFADKKSGRYDA